MTSTTEHLVRVLPLHPVATRSQKTMRSSENIAKQLILNHIKFNNWIDVLQVPFTRYRRMNPNEICTGRKQIRRNNALQYEWTNSMGNSPGDSLLDIVSAEKQHIIHCLYIHR